MTLRLRFGVPRAGDEDALALYLLLAEAKRPFERVADDTAGAEVSLELDGRVARGLAAGLALLSDAGVVAAEAPARVAAVLEARASLRALYPLSALATLPSEAATAALVSEPAEVSAARAALAAEAEALGEPTTLGALGVLLGLEGLRARAHGLPAGAALRSLGARVEALPALARWRAAAREDEAG